MQPVVSGLSGHYDEATRSEKDRYPLAARLVGEVHDARRPQRTCGDGVRKAGSTVNMAGDALAWQVLVHDHLIGHLGNISCLKQSAAHFSSPRWKVAQMHR